MSELNIVLLCLALAVLALFTVSLINHNQMRRRLIGQRLQQLRKKVSEIEELCAGLESLTGSRNIIRALLEHTVEMVDGMLTLQPQSQALQISKESLESRIEQLSGAEFAPTLNRAMNSDAQVARAQFGLNEAGRIIRSRQAAGKMELAAMNDMIEQLAWANMMVSVVSAVVQGHKYLNKGDVLQAYSFYKKATQTAMENNLGDERRHQLIKELVEITNNKRRALSENLMPETQFNPPDTVELNPAASPE
ncbi:hypothetical protein [Agaribacterium haliotis]|uniref:hypothetical protein n=1 Tax=Agaribacterium haliotis TaxID=2013869 RepID=UPI000BB55020|nr:hypothetical protein [Agaribacterium haliotis]